MTGPEPLKPPEGADGTAAPKPGSTPSHRFSPGDPPTIRTTSGGLTGSFAGLAAGSSVSRVQLVSGPGPVSSPAGLPLALPHAGDRVDVFDLEASIGVGGMGAVFRALDSRLDRHVALKILPPEQAHDPEVVQRFYQEGRAAASLDHENIARVFTIGHDGRYHFIAFEYIEGTTVRQRVEKNGPLPVSEAINFTLQIADALVHAAERGVVHRDIKPSNIIVTPHGRAKLVDMGLARRFERGGDDGLTQSGMTLGTFDYISPEQARDPRDVDVRSDLYSLGCTLFHMLTGRPPFPEGTVLQKLIQHQEEAPPDVRSLNTAAPPDLANILVKLMAKDRDRRYQTPEQLVRDLLTVAGALGLRSVSPEGLVWLSAGSPPAWQRHLVWGIPALALAVIVCGLLWWGQDAGRAPSSSADASTGLAAVKPSASDRSANPPGASPSEALRTPNSDEADPDETPAGPAAPAARKEVAVDSNDDLLARIAAAPPRSVIVLTDEGPYNLGIGRDGRASPERMAGRDLTVRAGAGIRPVLRLARELSPGLAGRARASLLDFAGGRVTFVGVEFLLDPGDRPEPLAGVRVEDAELTLRRCVFRRPGEASGARVFAVDVRATAPAAAGDRPPAAVVDQCHFVGDEVGVRASGPADLLLRDCTLAVSGSAVWLDNSRAASPVPADLRLSHVSIVAGEAPVFRFEGTDPRVRIDDSAVAPAADGELTLVSSDLPDTLSWQGRGNLYARVGTFLLPTDGRLGREAVRDPDRWRETPEAVRESAAEFASQPVWGDPDPARTLAKESPNPARAFRLAPGRPGPADVGARQGPFGPITPSDRLAAKSSPATKSPQSTGKAMSAAAAPSNGPGAVPTRREARETTARGTGGARPAESPAAVASRGAPESAGSRAPGVEPDERAGGPAPNSTTTRMDDLPEMPLMPPAGREVVGSSEAAESRPDQGEPTTAATPPTTPRDPAPVAVGPANPNVGGRADRALIRTADQLLNALARSGARDGHLWVAADADWELPTSVVRATGSWRVQAEPGRKRPRLRFLPAHADVKPAPDWTTMFELRSGSIQLDGFDVVLPAQNAPKQGRWSAFTVRPGTDLSLSNCTVTVEGGETASAVVAVEAGDGAAEAGVAGVSEPSAATVRLTDALVRAGGDLVDVGAGLRFALETDNAVIATGGSLAHAHGVPRGRTSEKVSLTLRQTTAEAAGGLVQLESAAGGPELPVASVNARYSILTTGVKDTPLIRVDGQDAPSTMRDRIDWEGLGVAYHKVATYRRDQSAQVGAAPILYDRQSWTVAVGAREQSAVHGDVKFRRELDPKRPPWTLERDDVKLGDDSPARASGSDLERIPEPPPASSRDAGDF